MSEEQMKDLRRKLRVLKRLNTTDAAMETSCKRSKSCFALPAFTGARVDGSSFGGDIRGSAQSPIDLKGKEPVVPTCSLLHDELNLAPKDRQNSSEVPPSALAYETLSSSGLSSLLRIKLVRADHAKLINGQNTELCQLGREVKEKVKLLESSNESLRTLLSRKEEELQSCRVVLAKKEEELSDLLSLRKVEKREAVEQYKASPQFLIDSNVIALRYINIGYDACLKHFKARYPDANIFKLSFTCNHPERRPASADERWSDNSDLEVDDEGRYEVVVTEHRERDGNLSREQAEDIHLRCPISFSCISLYIT